MANTSKVRLHMNGRLVTRRGPIQIAADSKITHQDLNNVGINLKYAMDALHGGGSGGVPGYVSRQALETWLPGTLRAITVVRNIDQIVGITNVGRWEDEAIKMAVAEHAGQAELYGDNANIPLADIRTTTESRGLVRFEQGFRVGRLEEARLNASGYQAVEEKRKAASDSLDIARNAIGFRGYASAESATYGLLNDPNLSAYQHFSDSGAGGAAWSVATFNNLVTDFTRMVDRLESQMGGHLQDDTPLAFVIPTGYRNALQVREANTGTSFREWLTATYPNVRIVTTPEFKDGNGTGVDVAYLIAESVSQYDESDINGATVIQAVPERYRVLGSKDEIKGYLEDAVMATAGVIVLRPWAVARYTISAA